MFLNAFFKKDEDLTRESFDTVLDAKIGFHRVSPTFCLKDICLSLHKGSGLALIGENGSGKSTLLRMLTGLTGLKKGSVRYCGKDMKTLKGSDKYVGYIQQYKDFPEKIKISEYLNYQLSLRSGNKNNYQSLIALSNLKSIENTYASTLSGGNQRILHILGALAHGPEVLILDEPTSGLDEAARIKVWDFISALKHEGLAVIFSTHYLEEVNALADEVLVLREGLQIYKDNISEFNRHEQKECIDVVLNNHALGASADMELLIFGLKSLIYVDGIDAIREGIRVRLTGREPHYLPRIVETAAGFGADMIAVKYYEPNLSERMVSIYNKG